MIREQRRTLIRVTRFLVQIHIALIGVAFIIVTATVLQHLWVLFVVQCVAIALIASGLVIACNTLKELRWLEETYQDSDG